MKDQIQTLKLDHVPFSVLMVLFQSTYDKDGFFAVVGSVLKWPETMRSTIPPDQPGFQSDNFESQFLFRFFDNGIIVIAYVDDKLRVYFTVENNLKDFRLAKSTCFGKTM